MGYLRIQAPELFADVPRSMNQELVLNRRCHANPLVCVQLLYKLWATETGVSLKRFSHESQPRQPRFAMLLVIVRVALGLYNAPTEPEDVAQYGKRGR